MQPKCFSRTEGRVLAQAESVPIQGPDLRVFAGILPQTLAGPFQHRVKVFYALEQGLAVVSKRHRHQALAGQPALDAAEHHPVGQRRSRRAGGQNQGLVSVGALQAFEPSRRVKDRCLRMRLEQLSPTWVLQWINLMNSHCDGVLSTGCPKFTRGLSARKCLGEGSGSGQAGNSLFFQEEYSAQKFSLRSRALSAG